MNLVDLGPRWVGAGGKGVTSALTGEPVPERKGVGISFDCPCGCGDRCYVDFKNPLDGKGPYGSTAPSWERTGETFETLILKPSIQRVGDCGWHGFIGKDIPGEVTTV